MRTLLLTSALALTLASAPGFAAEPAAVASPAAPGTAAARTQAASRSPWITVTAAENIVGRTLRDPQGHDAGRIHSLVVDLTRGDVLYAVVGSAGKLDLGGNYVAVPFSQLRLTPNDDYMNVMLPAEKIGKAPHLTEAQLSRLGAPEQVATVYNYYAVPLPYGFPAAGTATATVSSPRVDRLLLVRRDEVVRLDTGRDFASNLRGADVKAANGDEVGEVDRIVVDPASGRIAYVLLSHGGFLGMGEDWVPVPAQALSWSQGDEAFKLSGKAPTDKYAALRKGDEPTQVRREQLAQLYARFGVQPYWQAN